MNWWTAMWITLLIIIPVIFLTLFIYFLAVYVFRIKLCTIFTRKPRYYHQPVSNIYIPSRVAVSRLNNYNSDQMLKGKSWVTSSHNLSNSPISSAFVSFNTPSSSPVYNHRLNNNNNSNSLSDHLDKHSSCNNFLSLMHQSINRPAPASISNISCSSFSSLQNSSTSMSSITLSSAPFSVNRYIMCSSEKEAKSRAQRAGGGNEPIFHPPNKQEASSHPHFHPNLPNATTCCVNYFFQYKKCTKLLK